MCHIKLNDDTYFTFALWPHGQRRTSTKREPWRYIFGAMPIGKYARLNSTHNLRDPTDVMHAQWSNYASRKAVNPKKERDTQQERQRGEGDRERAIIKTQKPFKSSPNFVLDSVTPKRSQRNEILFGFFFFFFVPPSTPAKEDTRRCRQRRSRKEQKSRERRADNAVDNNPQQCNSICF